MYSNDTQQSQYKTISNREKFCFGIGALGKDAPVNLMNSFYMLFLTDSLFIAPAFIGVLYFVARIWDAFNDPMMGLIVDNTRSKYGKFRIWLVIGTLVNSVVILVMYRSFHLQGTALYAFVAITYILYGMTYTIMDVPYWSWLPNLTNDPREREKVSVIPRIFASMSCLIIGTFGLYVIKWFNASKGLSDLSEYGFTSFAVIIVILFLFFVAITVFNVKEESTAGAKGQKTGFKKALKVILKNDQLLIFMGYLLTYNLCIQFARGFAVYYFKVVCGNQYLYSVFGMTYAVEMLGLFLMPYISGRLGRPNAFKLSCAAPVIGLVMLGVSGYLAPDNVVLVAVSSGIFMFGTGLSTGVTTCCMADVIDYGQVKFGVRNESVTCSAQTFLMKMAIAFAGLFTGVGLQMVGYDAKLAVPTARMVNGIRGLMLLVPVVFVILSYTIYRRYYKLKGEKLEEVLKEAQRLSKES